MRIRTIKPEFFFHEDLHDLEKESKLPLRLAFIGLWCAADKEGRFKWEPKRLGAQILPYDSVDFSRVLHALTTRGFVIRYASTTRGFDEFFGYIPTFKRHQVVNNRERESELPDPSTEAECDACPTREPRVPHAGKAEGKGREQGKEGEGEGEATPPKRFSPPEISDWIAYGISLTPAFPHNECTKTYDYYASKGWKVGNSPMKNWQAALRTCHGRWKDENPSKQPQFSLPPL